jgi:hypothetical protein
VVCLFEAGSSSSIVQLLWLTMWFCIPLSVEQMCLTSPVSWSDVWQIGPKCWSNFLDSSLFIYLFFVKIVLQCSIGWSGTQSFCLSLSKAWISQFWRDISNSLIFLSL